MRRLGSGPRLVGRIGPGVSFRIFRNAEPEVGIVCDWVLVA